MKLILNLTCALAAGLIATQAVRAADIYRWTDAQGKVHLTDRTPPPDAKDVTRVDARKNSPTQADMDIARRQAASDRARLARIEAEKAAAARTKAASAPPAGGGQSTAAAGGTECERKQRAYQTSASCWGGFNLAKGGTREGALAKCGPPLELPACN